MASIWNPPTLNYDNMWMTTLGTKHLVLGARTCGDLLMALSAGVRDGGRAYEVNIGGYRNSRTCIRPGIQDSPNQECVDTVGNYHVLPHTSSLLTYHV